MSPESILKTTNPAGNYMFKVNNRNTRTRFEICLKLTRKTLERRYWRRSGDFIIYFEHVSHLANFKQVNAGWKSFHSIFDPAVNYLFKVKTLEQGVKDVK